MKKIAAVSKAPAPEQLVKLPKAAPPAKIATGLTPASRSRPEAASRLSGMTTQVSLGMTRGAVPAPMRGSLALLERQNKRLEAEGLERIEDDADLKGRIAQRLLVPLPASKALLVNPELPEIRRYSRPWTAAFLTDLARVYLAAFHNPIRVTSAVRTVDYQKRLERTNGNAAPAEGDVVSPHLLGSAIDLAKNGMTRQQIAWMRRVLQLEVAAGNIDVEEEFQQACFHVTVYRSYAPSAHHRQAPTRTVANPARPARAPAPAQAREEDQVSGQ